MLIIKQDLWFFSEDSRLLAETSRDGPKLIIWDIQREAILQELSIHEGIISALKFSSRNSYLLSGGTDGYLNCFNPVQKESINSFKCVANPRQGVTSIAVSGDEKRGITSSTDHILRVWDLAKKRRIKLIHGHADIILQVQIDEETRHLISASLDGTIRLWDLNTFSCQRIIQLPFSYLRMFDLIDASKLILLVFENSIVCIMDLKTGDIKWQYRMNEHVLCAYWMSYPSKIIIQTTLYAKIYTLFWEYVTEYEKDFMN